MTKRIAIYTLFISTHSFILSQSTKDLLLEDIRTYSPNSFALLEAHEALESSYYYSHNGSTISTVQNTDTYEFVNWDDFEAALNSMSTNLHEICHSYNHFIPYWSMKRCECGMADLDFIHEGYFISPDENLWIQVDKSLLFPSRGINSAHPRN